MSLPALRALDIFPVEHQGETRYCVRDVDGINERMILLTREQVVLAASLDGFVTAEDLKLQFEKAYPGREIGVADIEKFVKMLDEQLLLETPRFHAAFAK